MSDGPMDRKFLALTAQMDGERVVAANIGRKVKVSQMELVTLCTFAEVGLMSVFSGIEGETGDKAQADLDRLIGAIRDQFGKDGDGLNRLTKTCAAMLRGEKFAQYVVPVEE